MSKQQNRYNSHIFLSRSAQKTIFNDIHERSSIEACGVLLGEQDKQGNWLVEEACPLPNIFASPVYFEFAPEDLLEAELRYPDQIIGVYHSHPTGFPRASSTDKENMQRVNREQEIPWAWLIVSGPFDTPFTRATLLPEQLIAYHHYANAGLQRLAIQLAPQEVESSCQEEKDKQA